MQKYSRELKIACMREVDSGKYMVEVARAHQLSPKMLERWRREWRALGESAFPAEHIPDLHTNSILRTDFGPA